jgi:hypothetical protein
MVFMEAGSEVKLRRIVPVGTPVAATLLTKVKVARLGAAQDEGLINKQVD